MKTFKYHDAATLGEAVSLLKDGRSAVLAGGTDILNVLKQGALPEPPEALVNIKNIAGLDRITGNKLGLKIGALARISDIASSGVIKKDYPALARAAAAVSAPTLRNMGTLGGNLCQEVQCWYFRRSHLTGTWFNCLRKGGSTCYALTGDNRYHSVFGGIRASATPCAVSCPAQTDIPAYVSKVREKDLDGAAEIILRYNPFPAVTGRVCPHFCESTCNRGDYDEPVSVKQIERYLGDYILKNKRKFIRLPENDTQKKIAVVGSGPAGLSAAYFLRRFGHNPTVFETMPFAGGTMALTIPGYRLPGNILQEEIEFIRDFGIDIQTDTHIGKALTIPELMGRGYDAVFVAIGAQAGRKLPIPGADLEGTMTALDFLRDIKTPQKPKLGKRVVVIGGGSVAFDCARSAIRLGAGEVRMICLESRETMPADPAEISEGEAEGITVNPSLTATRLTGRDGRVTGVECIPVLSMKFDETGAVELKTAPEPKSAFPADTVIFAIGQAPDLSVLEGTEGLKYTRRNTIEVDPETLATAVRGIYAGGDVATTAGGAVIQAIACGKKAAVAIDRYLGGTGNIPDVSPPDGGSLLKCQSPCPEKSTRVVPPEMPVAERIKSMDAEVVAGVDPGGIEAEAGRCLNCSCIAVSHSDIAPALIALDARIKTTKRTVAAGDFFALQGGRTTVLDSDEIVTGIHLPAPKKGTRQAFIKFAQRPTIDFACVSAAAVIAFSGAKVSAARIVLGAVAPAPYRATAAEAALKGRVIDDESAAQAAEALAREAVLLPGNPYKLQIARALVKRAILAAGTGPEKASN